MSEPNGPGAYVEPNVLRLQIVLTMAAQGKSQREIAAHIGRDERTVRRMIGRARDLRLAASDDLTPEDAVAQVFRDFAELKADMLDLKREAEAARNFKHRIWAARELLRIEMAFVLALDRIGFFDANRSAPSAMIDPGAQRAKRLIDAAQDVFSPDSDTGVEGQGHDQEA